MSKKPVKRIAKSKKPTGPAALLGVGLDNDDGHKRITSGEQFAIIGGSEETHGRMTETVVKTFESLKFEGLDKEVRDELLLSYFSQFDTLAVAKDKLNKMSDHERTMELGSRSVGKYGCYSCHNLEGFDGRAPIGPPSGASHPSFDTRARYTVATPGTLPTTVSSRSQ